MIVKRGVTRMKIYLSTRISFIILFALIVAPISVIGVSAKNTTNNCGGDFSGYQYTISSPNYPENYPEDHDCLYVLHGSQLASCDQVFHLQFLDFALTPAENCDQDYLKIGERSLYCGSVVGIRNYPSKNNSLTLRFHSGAGRSGKGFKILVTTSPCANRENNRQSETNFTEQTPIEGEHEVTTMKTNVARIGSRKDLESVSLREDNSYPVYRPEVDFAIEDNRQFGREDQSQIETLEKSEKNTLQRIQQNSPQYLSNTLELPVHQSKLFREQTSTKLQIVTPTSIKSETTPKISWHLFVPATDKDSVGNGGFVRFSSGNVTKDLKNDVDNFVTAPPTKLLLPNQWNTRFRETAVNNTIRQFPLVEDRGISNQRFIVPARSYGVPNVPYYPSVKASEPEVKTGEVLENSSGTVDCQGKTNLEPDLEVTANFRGKNPALIDFVGTGSPSGFPNNNFPATTYGVPGLNYPNTGFDKIASFNYQPQADYYPGNTVVTGSGRPNNWIPSTGFPINNVGNDLPNYLPPPGIGSGNIYPGNINRGIGGRYSECCNNVYSAQRVLLASPGFPSFIYSGNSYECIYTIRSYSLNICQMRFNFKFFNHGTEDRFCSYGYVEIDGRRICGCKKGFSIVSAVSSAFPKTIGVKYSGYPRSKFNGFLIEVIQEPCANSYPFGSRRKKEVGNAMDEAIASNLDGTLKIANSSVHRIKRNLGYSYTKPNFGLIEVSGGSQWNSGSSVETGIHQLLNEGGNSASLFSPLLTCQALSFFDWTIAAKEVYLRGGRCIRNGGTGITSPGWIPSYPGQLPGYPGIGGTVPTFPSHPGNGGSVGWNPSFPGGSGNWNPGIINPGYPGSGSWNFPLIKCEDINVIEGTISSPQYPTNYPNNVKKCFRFYKAPDSCQLELAILDFDLENSPGCTKDYMAFSGQNRRYCGKSLAGRRTFLDISRCNVVDIYFVSDSFGSRRGFSAGFSQIPCRGLINQ